MPEKKIDKLPSESFIHATATPVIEHWSHIRCGSYTSEWIARAMGLNPPPANKLLLGPVWFDVFRPIFPHDMRQLFRFQGMHSIELTLADMSDEERLHWLKEQIAVHKIPPAILIRTKTMHWIAVAGYNDANEVFYIYDARYGNDSTNTSLPIGNTVMKYDTLLDLWRGRTFLRYRAILITSINPQERSYHRRLLH